MRHWRLRAVRAGLAEYSAGADDLADAAGDAVAPLHDRCPVLIDDADFDGWLDREVAGPSLLGLLRPPPPDLLVRRPASRRVNNVRNDGPDLLDPGSIDGPVPLRLL